MKSCDWCPRLNQYVCEGHCGMCEEEEDLAQGRNHEQDHDLAYDKEK